MLFLQNFVKFLIFIEKVSKKCQTVNDKYLFVLLLLTSASCLNGYIMHERKGSNPPLVRFPQSRFSDLFSEFSKKISLYVSTLMGCSHNVLVARR